MKQELFELQMQISYQEDTVAQLNEVVTRQQKEIERLTEVVTQLKKHIEAIMSGQLDIPDNAPPPHY